ncbi:MAG: hypothetical protein DRQ44_13420 [Gammaproteobacteria bacterium]|nr:MAG: hypothetical protein DRQ44_13420 [Gammaproteobacteria bacterium]
MEQYEHNVEDFDAQNAKQGDDTLLVKFFIKSRPDSAASLKEGRPIFKDVEYIDIKIPGSRTGGACRPARQNDIERFPRHYAAFKNRMEPPVEGTPLVEWPQISRSQAEELSFHNVKTVEQLADMADVHASKFMGMNALRDKAKAFLKNAAEAAPALALQAEIDNRDEQIRLLMERLNALEAQGIGEIAQAPELQPSQLDAVDPTDKVEPEAVAPKPTRKKRRRRKASDG